jgi:hypothetical protein
MFFERQLTRLKEFVAYFHVEIDEMSIQQWHASTPKYLYGVDETLWGYFLDDHKDRFPTDCDPVATFSDVNRPFRLRVRARDYCKIDNVIVDEFLNELRDITSPMVAVAATAVNAPRVAEEENDYGNMEVLEFSLSGIEDNGDEDEEDDEEEDEQKQQVDDQNSDNSSTSSSSSPDDDETDEDFVVTRDAKKVVHIPYSGRIDPGCCQSLVRACGLYSQCRGKLATKKSTRDALAALNLDNQMCNTCFQNMTTFRRTWLGRIQERERIISEVSVKPFAVYLEERHKGTVQPGDIERLAKKQGVYYDASLHFGSGQQQQQQWNEQPRAPKRQRTQQQEFFDGDFIEIANV